MSKFRKVAETEDIPSYIEDTFTPQRVAVKDDPYANLRQGASQRKFHIAREAASMQNETPEVEHEWERLSSAAVLNQERVLPTEDRWAGLNPEDVLSNAVRRAGYDTDHDQSLRDNFQWSTGYEAAAIYAGGTSIWDPARETMEDYCRTAASQQGMFEKKSREDVQKERTEAWEEEKLAGMARQRPRKTVMSRANAVIRTSTENLSDGAFGIPDYQWLEQQEQQRVAMADARREQRLAIKPNGKSPEDRYAEWEAEASQPATTQQEYKSDWLDQHLNDMMRKG